MKSIKVQSFDRQLGRCYYCLRPMWHEHMPAFAGRYGISAAQAGQLQATKEHLIARCDGGANARPNIVAACRYCNGHRHRSKTPLSPSLFQEKVRKRLANGKWHRLQLN